VVLILSGCKKDMGPDNSFLVNETFAMELISRGIPEDIAKFFAAARMETSSPDDKTCIYLQTFPNGASREMTLQVNPNLQYTPTLEEIANNNLGTIPIYGFKYSSSVLADGSSIIELNYFLAQEGLPIGAALSPVASGTKGAIDGIGIHLKEIGKSGADLSIGSLIDYAKESGVRVGPLGSLYALASALSSVTGALDLSKQISAWLGQLDELEKCAANPTNSLAQNDATYSAAAVAMIQAARMELKTVNAVRYLNSMTETGAGINPATAVLSVGLKSLFLWNDQALTDFCENTIMREVRLFVVRCNSGWKMINDYGDSSLSCDSPYGPWEYNINRTYPDGTKFSYTENIPYSADGISSSTFKGHKENFNATEDSFSTTKVKITPVVGGYIMIYDESIATSTFCFEGDCFSSEGVQSGYAQLIVPADLGECTSHSPLRK
jgi:hypothetical protein